MNIQQTYIIKKIEEIDCTKVVTFILANNSYG